MSLDASTSSEAASARAKVKPIHKLAEELGKTRGQKKIVMCHGVFDLLHIGHIRHLAEARSYGDTLIVTVTPDRHVNKGPGRPAFSQALRAEAVAALDCVDAVAVNEWPTAVETIRLLQPDVYAKGPDYANSESDSTGGIVLEQSAVEQHGGRIHITDDIEFSSSSLINRYSGLVSPEVQDYLEKFRQSYGIDDVARYLNGASKIKPLVVGEAIIDQYLYGEAIGKSSKEPILAVRRLSEEEFGGGALAVANHMAQFSEEVSLITFLGDRDTREDFIREGLAPNVRPTFLYRKDSPTITKKRIIDQYSFSKLLELYDINDGPLDEEDENAFVTALRREVPGHDLVVVSDFGHGMMSAPAIEAVVEDSRFLALNAQANAGNLGYHTISKYSHADFISIAEHELRLETRDRSGDLDPMLKDVSTQLGAKRVLATRGRYGCLCYDVDGGLHSAPALATRVLDRVGAGDALLAVSALCTVQGAPADLTAFIGNAVGAEAVAMVGNREPVSRTRLMRQIDHLLK